MEVAGREIKYRPLSEVKDETVKGIQDILGIFYGHNLVIWPDYGTLLGAIRDKDIIPHDYDVDMGFYAEDLPRIEAIIGLFEARGFTVDRAYRYGAEPEKMDRLLSTIILFRDKVKFELHPWHLKKDRRLRLKNYIDGEYVVAWVDKKFFEDMVKVDFLQRQCWVPTPAEEYLDFLYNKNWRTPLPYFQGDQTNVITIKERRDVEGNVCQMCRQEIPGEGHKIPVFGREFLVCGYDAQSARDWFEGRVNGHVINMFWGAGRICQNSWITIRDYLRKFGITEVLEIGTGMSTECFVNEGIKLISLDYHKAHSQLYQRLISLKGKVHLLHYEGDPAETLAREYPGKTWDFVFVDSPHERAKEVRLAMKVSNKYIYLHDPNSGEQGFFPNEEWLPQEGRESKLFMKREAK